MKEISMPHSIDKVSQKELLPSLSKSMTEELSSQTNINRYKIELSTSDSLNLVHKKTTSETVPNKRLHRRPSSGFTLNINKLISDLKTMLTEIKFLKSEYVRKRTTKARNNVEKRKGWITKKNEQIKTLEKKIKTKEKRLASLENQLRRYDNLLEGLEIISKKRLKENNLDPETISNNATQDADRYKKTKVQRYKQEIKILSYQGKIIEFEERTRKDKEKIKRVERKACEKYDEQIKIYENLIIKYRSPKYLQFA